LRVGLFVQSANDSVLLRGFQNAGSVGRAWRLRWFTCSCARARRARFGGRGQSVDDCVAALSGRVQDAHRSEAVGHLLGKAALDRGGVGELGRVEERGQVPRKQAGCIVWAGDADAILVRDESAPEAREC
jgi:hypothetical protein